MGTDGNQALDGVCSTRYAPDVRSPLGELKSPSNHLNTDSATELEQSPLYPIAATAKSHVNHNHSFKKINPINIDPSPLIEGPVRGMNSFGDSNVRYFSFDRNQPNYEPQ